MEDLLRRFRAGARRRTGGTGYGKRYSAELRELAVRYYEAARAAGRGQRAIAAKLGVAPMTILRWVEARPTATPDAPAAPAELAAVGPLREVVISDDGPSLAPVLVTPEGFRFEGLTVDELSIMLRALR